MKRSRSTSPYMKYTICSTVYNQLPELKKLIFSLKQQTFHDFELIVADDGSSDGTYEFMIEDKEIGLPHKYVRQEDAGYRLVEIINKAAERAEGDYIVWIMSDSSPKEDFLEKLDKVVAPNRLVNGMRVNVDKDGKIIGPDWRIEYAAFELTPGRNEQPVYGAEPWKVMTLNTMCIPTEVWKKYGGIPMGYNGGYGRMDWDMAAWCLYNNIRLYWATEAVCFEEEHPKREDRQENVDLFTKRLEQFQKGAQV